MHLTPRQLDVIRYILRYRSRWGYSPTLQEIADHLGVSAVTIYEHTRALERKGALRRTPNQARSLEVTDPELLEALGSPAGAHPPEGFVLPLAGEIAAGRPIEALEDVEQVNLAEMLALDRATYILRVRGDSMIEDHIRDGDYVLVEQRDWARDGETVVALLPDGEVTLKKFYREADRIRLQPANPRMEPIYAKEVQIQGVVVGIIRRCSPGPSAANPDATAKSAVARPAGDPSERSLMTPSALRQYWRRAVKRTREQLRPRPDPQPPE